ncbi:MAG TPA: prolyl oligopeptidase family serine peptidase [Thermoleophilaceae bacterium]
MRFAKRLAPALALLLLLACGCGQAGLYSERDGPAKPKGAVLVIHGGAWHVVGPRAVYSMRGYTVRLNRLGYSTLNIDYRRGRQSLPDVLAAYDGLRRELGPGVPICALGTSAGGNLALLLAERRSDVACVVAEAPPTLIAGLTGRVRGYAREYFPTHADMAEYSPALHVDDLHAPVLVAQALHDPTVPYSQSSALVAADPRIRRIALRPGRTPWIHAKVYGPDVPRLDRAEAEFIGAAIVGYRGLLASGPGGGT